MDSCFVLIRVHLLNIAVKSVHCQSRVLAVIRPVVSYPGESATGKCKALFSAPAPKQQMWSRSGAGNHEAAVPKNELILIWLTHVSIEKIQ